MAFIKRVSSSDVKVITGDNIEEFDKNTSNFPVGTMFMLDEEMYTVTEVIISDSTEMRRVRVHDNDEIRSLASLQKEIKNQSFKFLN